MTHNHVTNRYKLPSSKNEFEFAACIYISSSWTQAKVKTNRLYIHNGCTFQLYTCLLLSLPAHSSVKYPFWDVSSSPILFYETPHPTVSESKTINDTSQYKAKWMTPLFGEIVNLYHHFYKRILLYWHANHRYLTYGLQDLQNLIKKTNIINW